MGSNKSHHDTECPLVAEAVEELLKIAFSASIGVHRQIGELLNY